MARMISRISQQPWFWALIAALGTALVMLFAKGPTSLLAILPVSLGFASLYVIVGTGQMVVMSSGPGNIDLSIPMVMTLSAYLAVGQMHGQDSGLLLGLLAGLACGIAAGSINAVLILRFRMPPMIVTLAVGLVAQSVAYAYAKLGVTTPSPSLQFFATGRLWGIPILPVIAGIASLGFVFLMYRSRFIRSVFATGQNARAAYLAGVNVGGTMFAVYVLSGALAGLGGIVVAGFQGGTSLAMAGDYLLISIAVVVLGGTPVSGGKATLMGTWLASIFLFLLLSLLNSFQVPVGLKNIITGTMIVGMLIIAALLSPSRSRLAR